jgi:hypothetical protein
MVELAVRQVVLLYRPQVLMAHLQPKTVLQVVPRPYMAAVVEVVEAELVRLGLAVPVEMVLQVQ